MRLLLAIGLAILVCCYFLLPTFEGSGSGLVPEAANTQAPSGRSAPHLETALPALPPDAHELRESVAAAQASASLPAISGQLVTTNGKPLSNRHCDAVVVRRRGGSSVPMTIARLSRRSRVPLPESFTTDSDGFFHAKLPDLPTSSFEENEFWLSVHTSSFSGFGLLVPEDEDPSQLNAGQLAVPCGAVIVAGHVRNHEGNPLPLARVRVEPRESPSGARRFILDSPDFEFEFPRHNDFRTDDWGAFQIFDDGESTQGTGPWDVLASLRSFRGSREAVPTGTQDLELTLIVLGQVKGHFVEPPEPRIFTWHALLLPVGQPPPERLHESPRTLGSYSTAQGLAVFSPNGRTSRQGTFTLLGITPGWYDLHVYNAQLDARVLTLARLEVPSGPCLDARLKEIDPMAFVPNASIHVTDSNASPLEHVRISMRPGSDEREVQLSPDGPSPRLIPLMQDAPVLISAPGYQPLELNHVTGDRTVVLERGFHVTLELAETAAWKALPPEYTLLALLKLESAIPTSPARIDAGTAEVAIGGPGTYTIQLILDPHDPSEQRLPLRVPTQTNTVEITKDGQAVRIKPLPGFFESLVP